MIVVDASFAKIKQSLVDQTNSNNVASSGDVSTEIHVHHIVTVHLQVAVLKG